MPFISNQYQGVDFMSYPIEDYIDADRIDRAINSITINGDQDKIVSIFMTPAAFTPSPEYHHIDDRQVVSFGMVKQQQNILRPSTLDGYTPRNRKLLTFPYLYVAVDTLNSCKNYRFEFSQTPAALHFTAYMAFSPVPEVVCAPQAYNGTTGLEPSDDDVTTTRNFTEAVTVTGFPQCAYVIDSYRAWVAQKSTGFHINNMAALAGMGIAAIGTGGISAAAGLAGVVGLANNINQAQIDMTQNTRVRGDTAVNTDTAIRAKGIYFKVMSLSAEYAAIIDGFFDRYGYAQNTFAVPNLTARNHWTYIQTKECNAKASNAGVPADSLKKIKDIFNKGITFWRNLSEVGDYTLDNRVVI